MIGEGLQAKRGDAPESNSTRCVFCWSAARLMLTGSLRRHEYSEAHFDKFFVIVDRLQGAANVVGYLR